MSFVCEIILECSIDILLEEERKAFDFYHPEYNTAKDPLAPMAGRKHKPETIAKFKLRPRKFGPDNHSYGRKHTEEWKLAKAESQRGTKRTLETKAKMRATAITLNRVSSLDKYRHLQMKKIIDNYGNIFESLVKAAIFWKMSVQAVCDNLKGRSKTTSKGIVFKYV